MPVRELVAREPGHRPQADPVRGEQGARAGLAANCWRCRRRRSRTSSPKGVSSEGTPDDLPPARREKYEQSGRQLQGAGEEAQMNDGRERERMLTFSHRILFVGFGARRAVHAAHSAAAHQRRSEAHHDHGLRAGRGGAEALARAGGHLRPGTASRRRTWARSSASICRPATSSSTWPGTSTAARSCSGATTTACCTSTRRWSSGIRTPGRTTSTRPSGRSTGAT